MPKLAANLSMLFNEASFPERFALAARCGFKFVEYLFPYAYEASHIKQLLNENSLTQVLFNLPCGDWASGERGIAANPAREAEFRAGVETALGYAEELGVKRLNCLAGKNAPPFGPSEQWETLCANARFAAKALAERGITLVVEAINHFDIPGFFLHRTSDVLRLIDDVGEPNLKIQYDVYHAQREEGEIVGTLRQHIAQIGHIQVADNPGRHEPGSGELNYPFIFAELDRLNYQGFVGLEYVPAADTAAGLGFIKEMGCEL